MAVNRLLRAALMGACIAVAPLGGEIAAQTLQVMRNSTSSELDVPMNRAVVVESDVPFAELSIANPNIADISSLSERTIYVLGKQPGRTTLTLLGADGRLITNVEVQVTPDISEFKERLQQIMPGEQIEVRTANDGIVLSGTVSSIARLDRALELAQRYAPDRVSNLLTVGGVQQVMLKVRFAEMQRSVSKSLSTSLALRGDVLGDELGVVLGTQGLSTGTAANSALDGNLIASGDASGAVLLGFDLGGLEAGILLEALENRGVVRTLAEPNLTALSGQEASFLAGGEYPVPVTQEDGNITIQYRPFGVQLGFIPTVVDDDLINLELDASVSSIDPANGFTQGGFTVDAFRTRQTATTVQMRDGESFAIAGLLSDDFSDLNAQVPWLGDLPVLGALFRSAEYERQQTELVIIVTPHLVTPTRGEALALPTDRVTLPTERELFLFGRVEGGGQAGAAGEVARQDFSGSYGYVME